MISSFVLKLLTLSLYLVIFVKIKDSRSNLIHISLVGLCKRLYIRLFVDPLHIVQLIEDNRVYTLEDNTYERNGSSEDGRLPAKFLKSRSAQDSACHNVPQIKTQEMNHKDFFRELANENV